MTGDLDEQLEEQQEAESFGEISVIEEHVVEKPLDFDERHGFKQGTQLKLLQTMDAAEFRQDGEEMVKARNEAKEATAEVSLFQLLCFF